MFTFARAEVKQPILRWSTQRVEYLFWFRFSIESKVNPPRTLHPNSYENHCKMAKKSCFLSCIMTYSISHLPTIYCMQMLQLLQLARGLLRSKNFKLSIWKWLKVYHLLPLFHNNPWLLPRLEKPLVFFYYQTLYKRR